MHVVIFTVLVMLQVVRMISLVRIQLTQGLDPRCSNMTYYVDVLVCSARDVICVAGLKSRIIDSNSAPVLFAIRASSTFISVAADYLNGFTVLVA